MKIHNLAFLLLFSIPLACNEPIEVLASYPAPDSQQKSNTKKPVAANIIFKSTDGGQTWQDISEGLPKNWQADDFQRDGFVATDNGLYLRAGNGIYHSKSNSTAPFWKKAIFPDEHSSIWSPRYTNFPEKDIRTVIETARGIVFIGCNKGLFKSTDKGNTWSQVQTGNWTRKLVESNGVLMATSQQGIVRSTDDGENWDCVISEGGVGITVEPIDGGFAAITYNTESKTRRVRTSYDGGNTWQPIDAGLPASMLISSIIQVGGYFYCGHPDGIFRSADRGKTWKLLLPAIENKVFNLSVSGNVIYAMPRAGGC